jgi:starch synthase (maltosyl-transferring)
MKIYYTPASSLSDEAAITRGTGQAAALGFDTLATAFGSAGDGGASARYGLLNQLAKACAERGLALMLDLALDDPERVSDKGRPDWLARLQAEDKPLPDPRFLGRQSDLAGLESLPESVTADFLAWWQAQLKHLVEAGVTRFRCLRPDAVPPALWHTLITRIRAADTGIGFHAWTPGLSWAEILNLQPAGFAGGFTSVAWWDGTSSWLAGERAALAKLGPAIAFPAPPPDDRPVSLAAPAFLRALRLAAATGDGLLVPAGFDFPVEIREANLIAGRATTSRLGPPRRLDGGGKRASAWLRRAAEPDAGLLLLINNDLDRPVPVPVSTRPLPASAGDAWSAAMPTPNDDTLLNPGEVRLVELRRTSPVTVQPTENGGTIAAAAPRIAIEAVTPTVEAGQFPAKRLVGEAVTIEADIFGDGHDTIAAEILWRAADESSWQRAPLQPVGNDRWRGTISPTRIGRHSFTVVAWRDVFASLCHDIEKKRAAKVDTALEEQEARLAVEAALPRAPDAACKAVLENALSALKEPDADMRAAGLLAEETRRAMRTADAKPFLSQSGDGFPLDVERPGAGFASWYELFPRSATDDPKRHGTFADVIERLPRIRDMGFDVLYFPPIHPIGRTNRKGRNNSLTAGPDDVGSPYAIGAEEGGHDAILPALGTPEDFRRLVAEARHHGIEIALDFAIQCAPDHPWLKTHPGWFQRRPDGSIRYAENPPKKYEDIVNVDFYAKDAVPELWLALRDVVLHWIDEGVKLFRVDNPHTKPFPFWAWLIAEIRGQHPDVVFLAEAFTRPKVMQRLAKLGFSQSYTYFTWRHSKQELTDYLTELSQPPVSDFFRPHFFVNTPDINPYFLQSTGRPGFLIRAVLAATLSGLWGVYSGFELCEAAPLPGREEYLDSEKYEIRVRDPETPGNIVAEITALNRLRRDHPALQSHLGIRFLNTGSDAVLAYAKGQAADGSLIVIAVNLDPHHAQDAMIEIPIWEWGIADGGTVAVEDLVAGHRFTWTGKTQPLRLDPNLLPYGIWRIAPPGDGR